MRFYKKNPEVDGDPFVCGRQIFDSTVVCGDEFSPFANPGTFPGRPPKLIEVAFEELTDAQKLEAKEIAVEQAGRPPRHLNAVTSANIATLKGKSDPIVIAKAPIDMGVDNKGAVRNPVERITEDKASDIEVTFQEKIPGISELYTRDEIVDTFPGITEKNVDGILSSFKTLEELAGASNASLRQAGIQPNFFDRVRRAATVEMNGYNRLRGK